MWKFEQSQRMDVSGVTCLAFDGRDVWAANSSYIQVMSYFDEEYLAHEFQFDNGLFTMRDVKQISHGTLVNAMVCWNNKMFVKSGDSITAYNTTTYAAVGTTINAPVSMQNEMCLANNKLWFVSADSDQSSSVDGIPASDCQQLYYYDLINSTWSAPILIPGKKQYTTRRMVDGLDGYLYITGLNDHSIVKFTTDGVYVGTYRINRHPYFVQVNQDKVVYVVSDAQSDVLKGMVSTFDQSTNTSTNYAAACGTIEYMADSGAGQLVYIGGTPKVALLNKSDKKIKYASQDPESDDYVPGAALEYGMTPLHGLVTPPLSFEAWDGTTFVTKTVKPYMFTSTSSAVYAHRLSSLVCVNSMEVLGTAMIATGAQNYYGDL